MVRWIATALLATTIAVPARAAVPTECLSSSEEAQAARDDGRYRTARRGFLQCASDACPAVVRRDCLASLDALDQVQPSLVFDVRDEAGADLAAVAVTMDGEPLVSSLDGKPVLVDLGSHELVFDGGPRYAKKSVKILARSGERSRRIEVRLAPALAVVAVPPPRRDESRAGTSPLPWILAGVGVLGVASFSYFGLTAKNDLSNLEGSPCAATRTCAEDDVRSVRTRYAVADVSLGVGAIALGAAVWLWLAQDRR